MPNQYAEQLKSPHYRSLDFHIFSYDEKLMCHLPITPHYRYADIGQKVRKPLSSAA